MRGPLVVARRELGALVAAPTALVFLLASSALVNLSVLGMEHLFDRGQADLQPLFSVLPWLGLLLLPALSMGLWSEERRTGSIELLLALPLATGSLVLGKFLAALGFAALALAGTTGLWIAISAFGEPDHGAILAAYLGALMLFAAFLALGSFVSALTRSQATAYVLSVALGFLFLFGDVPAIGAALESLAGGGARDLLASLSLSAHFEAVTRGVLGAADLVFFLSLTALFLAATTALVEGRRRDRRPIGRLALYLAALVGLNLAAPHLVGGLRLDATAEGLYTLDPATRRIAAELPAGTRLELFLTEEAAAASPRFLGFAAFVERLAEDLERASGGRLELVRRDPAPFTAERDRAMAADLTFVDLGVHGGGAELCFGAVATGPQGGEATIPFLSPERERHLEHELGAALLAATSSARPKVGVLGSPDLVDALFVGGLTGRGSQVAETLRARFRLERLPDGVEPLAALPDGLDVLWVLHPEDLHETTRRALHAYARAGGSMLVQVDPLAEADRSGMGEDQLAGYVAPRWSDLPELLQAWGLELVPRKVVVDRAFGRRLPAGAGGLSEAATNVHWLSAPAASYGDAGILDGLGDLSLYTPGQLRPLSGVDEAPAREALLSASGDSMLLDVSEVQIRRDPRELLTSIVAADERQVLAWRLHGETGPWPERAVGSRDRFGDFRAGTEQPEPAGAPGAAPGDQPSAPAPDDGPVQPMAAIVLADCDVLADGMWVLADERDGQVVGYQAYADNARLIEAMLADLAGGADLAAIGPRASYTRPFTRLVALEREAEERLARELLEARALEQQLAAELLEDERRLAETGVRPDPAAARDLRQRLGRARADLRELMRDRDAEVEALEARARWANVLGFPLLILLGALVRLVLARRR